MSKITLYGYFGPSTNVRDIQASAPSADAMAEMFAKLPRRTPVAAVVVPFERKPGA